VLSLLRFVVAVGLLGLVTAVGAQANHFEPKKRIVPADQARARAMGLKRADVAAFATQHPPGKEVHTTCAALDESDLVVTGHASSPEIRLGDLIFFQSLSEVYRSARDATSAWNRAMSAAGSACLEVEFRKLATGGLRFESFRSMPFPRFAQRTKMYRATYTGVSRGRTYRLYANAVYLLQSRAITGIFVGAPLVEPRKTVEVRLARTVAARMNTAMRGA
jgi:hypothetical protein